MLINLLRSGRVGMIAMATGYEHSRGAMEELRVARELKLGIVYQEHPPPNQPSAPSAPIGLKVISSADLN